MNGAALAAVERRVHLLCAAVAIYARTRSVGPAPVVCAWLHLHCNTCCTTCNVVYMVYMVLLCTVAALPVAVHRYWALALPAWLVASLFFVFWLYERCAACHCPVGGWRVTRTGARMPHKARAFELGKSGPGNLGSVARLWGWRAASLCAAACSSFATCIKMSFLGVGGDSHAAHASGSAMGTLARNARALLCALCLYAAGAWSVPLPGCMCSLNACTVLPFDAICTIRGE